MWLPVKWWQKVKKKYKPVITSSEHQHTQAGAPNANREYLSGIWSLKINISQLVWSHPKYWKGWDTQEFSSEWRCVGKRRLKEAQIYLLAQLPGCSSHPKKNQLSRGFPNSSLLARWTNCTGNGHDTPWHSAKGRQWGQEHFWGSDGQICTPWQIQIVKFTHSDTQTEASVSFILQLITIKISQIRGRSRTQSTTGPREKREVCRSLTINNLFSTNRSCSHN